MAEDKDNVVNFPTGKTAQEQVADNSGFILEMVERNRKEGPKRLEKNIEKLEELLSKVELQDGTPDVINIISKALGDTVQALEGINSLVDMIKNDLIGAITMMEGQAMEGWRTAMHLQVLLEVLKEKELVSEEEMRATWNKVVPPQFEGRGKI